MSRVAAAPGIALVVTLLGILVLELVAAGALLVAGRQVRGAGVAVRVLRLQLAAQDAVADALASWQPDSAAAVPPDSTRTLAGVPVGTDITRRASLRRISESLFLVRGEALGTAGEHRGVGALVRTAAPADYLASVPAAATVGGAVGGTGGHLSGTPSDACADTAAPAIRPALAATDTTGLAAALAVHVLEGGAVVDSSLRFTPRLAGVDLRALARHLPGGTVAPTADTEAGLCRIDRPDNWGAPTDPAHPCARHFPVMNVAGDLEVSTGMGQGVLLVAGSARFAPGTRFAGVVVTGESLVLEAGASVVGAVRTGGDLVLAGGTVRFEPCAVARAVLFGQGLRGPFRAWPRWWTPM